MVAILCDVHFKDVMQTGICTTEMDCVHWSHPK
jgi:hypothetical protein